jgi:hypothetical protein
MGGKTREHWEDVMERMKRLIRCLCEARRTAEKQGLEVAVMRANKDIDALIDALVVVDWEYTQHFGEPPEATKRVTGTMAQ